MSCVDVKKGYTCYLFGGTQVGQITGIIPIISGVEVEGWYIMTLNLLYR